MLKIMNDVGSRPSLYYSLKNDKSLLQTVINNPDYITTKFSELSNMQSDFGTWMDSIRTNALSIDQFYVSSPLKTIPKQMLIY